MNTLQMRQRLWDLAVMEGGAIHLAKKYGMSHSHISAVIRGDAMPGIKLLKAMGLKRVLIEKGRQPKYEDITN